MLNNYEEIVERQKELSRVTFRRLQELGLTPDQELQLDFAFVGEDEKSVRALEDYLHLETDYDVEVDATDGDWSLTGTTKETPVTLEILDGWVEWMVHAGITHGCEFDGWGTEL